MKHVMLDLETFGTRAGCAIRSIGSADFELSLSSGDPLVSTFYRNISRSSCESVGLVVDADTERWWSQQSQQAQDALLVDQVSLVSALHDFSVWFRRVGGVYVWAQGANFDTVLLEHAFREVGLQEPWKFYNVRDTRTAYDLGSLDARSVAREGTYHNALDDALHQIRCVQLSVARRAS